LREEMKILIDEEGLGKIETPEEKRQRLGRALAYMVVGPILLGVIVVGVVGGIMLHWALS
jgi:hypothetical protein